MKFNILNSVKYFQEAGKRQGELESSNIDALNQDHAIAKQKIAALEKEIERLNRLIRIHEEDAKRSEESAKYWKEKCLQDAGK